MFNFKGLDPNLHAILMVILSLAALAAGFILIRSGQPQVGEGIVFVVVGAIFPYAATVQTAASSQSASDKTVAAVMQAINLVMSGQHPSAATTASSSPSTADLFPAATAPSSGGGA